MSKYLVLGGTGSLGVALCKELIDEERVCIYSRDYHKQEFLRASLNNPTNFRWFLGDIRDKSRLKLAMRSVDYVINAAALKSVPDGEYNPQEILEINCLGHENVLEAALETNRSVEFISSDKAVDPQNLYGSTKKLGEGLTVAYNNHSGADGPRFFSVRYGNVLGSNGSVVPLFRSKLKNNIPFPITNPTMTRFWITLPQAAKFVVQCWKFAVGGEIFIPKLKASTISTLADAIALEHPKIAIGERPAEKLHERMISEYEIPRTYDVGFAYMIAPALHFWDRDWQPYGTKVDTMDYSSSSVEQLTVDELKEMLKDG